MSPRPRKLDNGKWRAERRHNGALRFLGHFRTKKDAQKAIADDIQEHGINPVGGKKSEEPRDCKVSMRVTKRQKEHIHKMAIHYGMTDSEFCLRCVFDF